eukprot:CAMPEP_0197716228 /NCGR_PEP_ID=MMETSP1434-20131217/1188_1 /TAXON_ID=265543 /ORGANISM="Minutocellus polymorphus, Strain CCMP3303" /LENGTH=306 /DNA_ID=CAMNT_0043300557 /DNA_START=140 /DNA_END=1060 /DNA_ORIENTATION=-
MSSSPHQSGHRTTRSVDLSNNGASSLPANIRLANRRSSSGCHQSVSEGTLLANTLSAEDKLERYQCKEQMDGNHFLTQEVLDLKMRLALAMAQIDAEKHTNRLHLEQNSILHDDNENLKHELFKAYHLINNVELQEKYSSEGKIDSNAASWLHQVKSNIGLLPLQASCAPSKTPRSTSPDTASLSSTSSSTNSSTSSSACSSTRSSIFTSSIRRLSLMASDLEDEELTLSATNERTGSVFSSLSSLQDECVMQDEGRTKTTRHPTCWAGKKESHSFALAHLFFDDEDTASEENSDNEIESVNSLFA